METRKSIIYFRGKIYEDTLYNRLVAKFLTVLYRIIHIFFVFAPLSIVVFMSCSSSSAKIGTNFYTDSIYLDSFGCNGHSYIRFRVPHSTNFQVVHNPDCFCRFNRTFIVIKKNK